MSQRQEPQGGARLLIDLGPLLVFFLVSRMGAKTGLYDIDSTPLAGIVTVIRLGSSH